MVKKSGTAQAAADTDTEHLPSTNGSQHEMHEFLRDFDDTVQCLSPDEVYLLSMGAVLTSGVKTAVMTVKHSLMLRAGYVSLEKYGVLNPIPQDGYDALYTKALALVASGEAIPNAAIISSLPTTPTAADLPDEHVVAPDRIALVDIKLKATILKCITSKGRRSHYAGVVGPSGVALLIQICLLYTSPSPRDS